MNYCYWILSEYVHLFLTNCMIVSGCFQPLM